MEDKVSPVLRNMEKLAKAKVEARADKRAQDEAHAAEQKIEQEKHHRKAGQRERQLQKDKSALERKLSKQICAFPHHLHHLRKHRTGRVLSVSDTNEMLKAELDKVRIALKESGNLTFGARHTTAVGMPTALPACVSDYLA